MDASSEHYILKITCPAASGIVAAISACLAQQQCYISELAQFDDEFTGQFFMRAVFRFNTGVSGDIGALREIVQPSLSAAGFEAQWRLEPALAVCDPTRLRQAALALVDIRVLDHLVIGDGITVSFAERGWL